MAAIPPQLCVILPTLNEAESVAPILARLGTALEGIGWEAIFVDDNSPDGTADRLREIAAINPHVRVIERIGRRGLSSAVIEGMLACAAPFIAVMDADGQHDPALLVAMLAAVEAGAADLAVASRFAQGASTAQWGDARRTQASQAANWLVRKLTGVPLTDPMSGFFLGRGDALRRAAPGLSGIGFKILLDLLIRMDGTARVVEFPLDFKGRAAGASKLDRVIALELLIALYDRWFGNILPTRFALFGSIGALGVLVHMAALGTLLKAAALPFLAAQIAATGLAMTANFLFNDALTYRDQRLHGMAAMLQGWWRFCGFCAVGAVANVAVATMLKQAGIAWWAAAIGGILVGAVWNFALSARFVWGRYK